MHGSVHDSAGQAPHRITLLVGIMSTLRALHAESRVPYTEWYYCSVAPHGMLAKGSFMVRFLTGKTVPPWLAALDSGTGCPRAKKTGMDVHKSQCLLSKEEPHAQFCVQA